MHCQTITRIAAAFSVLTGVLSCGVSDQAYTLLEWESVEYQGDIRISLAHPYNREQDDYEVLLASHMNTASLGLCVDDEQPNCQPNGPGYFPTNLIYSDGEKKFFRAASSALLEEGLVLHVIAVDDTGVVFDQRKIKFERSGGDVAAPGTSSTATPPSDGLGGIISQILGTPPSGNTGSNTGNATAGNTATGTTSTGNTSTSNTNTTNTNTTQQNTNNDDAAIRGIVQRHCGGCHAGYASDPASMKGTGAASMVQSGSMPKGRTMPAADKTALLDYLR